MWDMSLRDDLFLLAHDDAGKLVIGEMGIGAGLAGATLIDLLLSERIAVVDGRLQVVDLSRTGDAEADMTVDAIAANTEPCGPRSWVSWISHEAYQRVGEALASRGMVQSTTSKRLGLVTVRRWVATNPDDLVRVRSRLRYAIHGRELPDAVTAAMCGLVRVLRLESALLLSMPTSEILLGLERMTAANDVTIRQVTSAVEAVITSATYR